MNDSVSYWDACIACLPPEKRAAAERAFQEIADGGQDGFFPKVFLLLEAHAAYTNQIPERITAATEQALARVREVIEARPDNGGVSKEDMGQLLTAIRQVDGGEPVRAMKLKVDETAVEVKRLNRQVSRLRYVRLSVGLVLLLLVGLVIYGAYWRGVNGELISTVSEIRGTGLQLAIKHGEGTVEVVVYGANPKGNLLSGNNGEAIGVKAEFPAK